MQSGTNQFQPRINPHVRRDFSIDDCALIEKLCGVHKDSCSFPFDERIAELIGDFGRACTATSQSNAIAEALRNGERPC